MDQDDPARELILVRLGDGCPALTPAHGRSLAEAAAVCLEDQGHELRASLQVAGDHEAVLTIVRFDITDQMKRCYNDPDTATEQGACGIAILLVRHLTGFTVIEQSRRGIGFDYWLGTDEDLLFQAKARLEVSGIRGGDRAALMSRVGQKERQTRR